MRITLKFLALLGCASILMSCLKEEILSISPDIVDSEYITFGAQVSWPSDEMTRSGAESSDRLGSRTLLAEHDSTFSLPMGVYQQYGIQNLYGPATKGSQFTANDFTEMQVWATLATSQEMGGKTLMYIDGEKYQKNGGLYTTDEKYLWPGSGTLRFDVLANAPESITPNYSAVSADDNTQVISSFTYTTPVEAKNQKDIVYALATVSGNYGKSVPLTFEHITAAVNFKVGDIAHGTIKSITLKGVYNTGVYNFANGQWAILKTGSSPKSDYTVPIKDGSFGVDDNTVEGTFINDQDTGVLFMIPQIVGDGAIVEVVFAAPGANDRVLTASIAGDDWGKDIVTNYTISIDEQYNLNITPIGKLLDAHYIIAEVEITVEGMNDGSNVADPNKWQLTAGVDDDTDVRVTLISKDCIAEAEKSRTTAHANELSMVQAGFWCDEYVNRTGTSPNYVYTSTGESARGSTKLVSSGDITKSLVYVLIPENNSTAERRITLTLQKVNDPKVTKSVVLTQRCPGWTSDGAYGWETVDDDEDGQYGFTYTRKAHYVFTYSFTQEGWWSSTYTHIGFGTIDEGIKSVQTNYIDLYAPQVDNFTTFTTIDWGSTLGLKQKRYYLTIDYSVLNNLNIKETNNGLKNTIDLYDNGGSAVTTFEQIIANAPKTYRDETGPTFRERNSDDPTAFPASTGSINDLSGILTYVLKKNKYYLHSYNNGTADINAPILMSTKDIKWYIPAYGQFSTFTPNPNITDKNGGSDSADDYWSSTAAENAENPADAKSYHGGGIAIARTTELGVIAVRNSDNDTQIIEATATVDNSSLAGGDNGSTNNWL